MNTTLQDPNKIKQVKRIIVLLSITIPLIVFSLLSVKIESKPLHFLPSIYATINGITAIVLIFALIAIKKKNMVLHRRLIRTAFMLSILFLMGYITYHITTESTVYGDLNGDGLRDEIEKAKVGASLMIYAIILLTHIILSAIIAPLILFSYFLAWTGQFEKHKKLTRFSFPLWLYVAISGVVVYLMISPYYQH